MMFPEEVESGGVMKLSPKLGEFWVWGLAIVPEDNFGHKLCLNFGFGLDLALVEMLAEFGDPAAVFVVDFQ